MFKIMLAAAAASALALGAAATEAQAHPWNAGPRVRQHPGPRPYYQQGFVCPTCRTVYYVGGHQCRPMYYRGYYVPRRHGAYYYSHGPRYFFSFGFGIGG